MFGKEEKPGGARRLHRKGAGPGWDPEPALTPSQHGCAGGGGWASGETPTPCSGSHPHSCCPNSLHPAPLAPQAPREVTLASGCSPMPTLTGISPSTPSSTGAPHLAPHCARDARRPPARPSGVQPLSSRLCRRNAGRERGCPGRRPTAGRTRLPFFSCRRLQNAPLVPAVRSSEGSKCQGIGLGCRQTAPGRRAARAQGCPLSPGLPEDKSPFLLRAQAEASPGWTPSPC